VRLGEFRRAQRPRDRRRAAGADAVQVSGAAAAGVDEPGRRRRSPGGGPPEEVAYAGAAEPLAQVWIAVRASLRSVVERVTLADVAAGRLPARVAKLAEDPEAWVTR